MCVISSHYFCGNLLYSSRKLLQWQIRQDYLMMCSWRRKTFHTEAFNQHFWTMGSMLGILFALCEIQAKFIHNTRSPDPLPKSFLSGSRCKYPLDVRVEATERKFFSYCYKRISLYINKVILKNSVKLYFSNRMWFSQFFIHLPNQQKYVQHLACAQNYAKCEERQRKTETWFYHLRRLRSLMQLKMLKNN